MARQSGYSLIEMMVAVTITLAVMAGVFGLMLQNQNIYEQQTRLADVQQSARNALDTLVREVRMAGADPTGRAFAPSTACQGTGYATPSNNADPADNDVAPVTVAEEHRIRFKLDRGTFALGADPAGAPTPVPNPSPKQDCTGDGDYEDDNEDLLGDGLLNDPDEDIEYQYDATLRKLYRIVRELGPACTTGCNVRTPVTPAPKQPIAENVAVFDLKYYSTNSPTLPVPATNTCPPPGNYADVAAYETARDTCDPPLAFGGGGSVADVTQVRRVRVRVVVQTSKVDPLTKKPKTISLVAETTLRNRL